MYLSGFIFCLPAVLPAYKKSATFNIYENKSFLYFLNLPDENKNSMCFYTKYQLKTIQKIEHNLAYMDYAMIFLSIVLLVISITS